MNCPLESNVPATSASEAESGVACAFSPALNRRGFLQAVASGIGVVVLGGCTSSESGEPRNRTVMAVATGSEWQIPNAAELKPGEAIAFEFPDSTPGLVFVTKENQLRALSAKCTHTGCTVKWQHSTEILCPCHGSRFDLNGKVLNGPAEAPLPVYAARKQGSDVLIKRDK